jgi:hypothetical protein
MGEFEAMELEAVAAPAQPFAGRVAEARELLTGLLVTAAIAAVGTVLLTAGLLVVVVGSPLLAVGLGYLALRGRPDRVRAPRRSERSAW